MWCLQQLLFFLLYQKKAAANNGNTKPKKSVICAYCDGNGEIVLLAFVEIACKCILSRFKIIPAAILCSQCKGSGVNTVDVFNGQFMAGDSSWLCG